jgi:hypothetical protein
MDHDHVWELLEDIGEEPNAQLVAIAEREPALVKQAKLQVSDSVKFYADYGARLDEAKPDAVIVATSNDRHLQSGNSNFALSHLSIKGSRIVTIRGFPVHNVFLRCIT